MLMFRMMRMEWVVFARHLKQMLFTMLIVVACLAAGMGSLALLPSVAFTMVMFSMSTSGSAYDEQNDWGAYRLIMPISRRDVVLGRYAFNLIMALAAALGATILIVGLTAVGKVLPETGFVADMLAWNEERTVSAAAGMAVCVCIGTILSGVILPAYFKFGQTKATQWLPFIMLLPSVAPWLVIGMMGGSMPELSVKAIETLWETGGFGMAGVLALVISALLYCVSAYVSIKVYEARDL